MVWSPSRCHTHNYCSRYILDMVQKQEVKPHLHLPQQRPRTPIFTGDSSARPSSTSVTLGQARPEGVPLTNLLLDTPQQLRQIISNFDELVVRDAAVPHIVIRLSITVSPSMTSSSEYAD